MRSIGEPLRGPTSTGQKFGTLTAKRNMRGSVAAAQQTQAEAAQLAACDATGDGRVFFHELPGGCLVGCLDDGDAGVDGTQRGAGDDERALGEQAFESLEMDVPDLALMVGHGGGEVLARGMDEVDPLGHRKSLPAE